MSNPTSVGVSDGNPAVLEATTTLQAVTLDPQREYTVGHDGEDTAGSSSTGSVYLAVDAAVDNDASEGANKAKLINGRSLVIGPGVGVLKFRTASGSPTFTINPGPRLHGQW